MKKLLIIGPAWVGDMVMAQSLFKVIRLREPSSVIDVLAPDWSRPILERMPEVRMAHALSIGHGTLQLKERYHLAQTLKQYQYDQAIVLPNSWKSALIPYFAKIPKRTGYRGEYRYGLLNDLRILDPQAFPLMVERFNALGFERTEMGSLHKDINKMNAFNPKLQTDPINVQTTKTKFSSMKEERPILALCPGAEFGASKRWPEKQYAEVANQKLKEGWSVWLFGSKNDILVSERIQKETQGQCLDLTGKTSLGEAIDLLSVATAVVSNDSGLMHIAAALQKPLVAVYGSTDPNFTPPLGESSKIVRLALPCSPCFKRECPLQHHHCMQQLSSTIVLKALDEQVVLCVS